METFKMDVPIFDITKMCRTCLKTDDGFKSLFADENFLGITIPQMISECTIYPVKQDDMYPNKICNKCIQNAIIAYEFKKQYEKAYETLSSILNFYTVKEKIIIESADYMEINECEQKTETNIEETSELAFHPCEKCEEKFFSYNALKEHGIKDHKGSENKCRVSSKVYTRITHDVPNNGELATSENDVDMTGDLKCGTILDADDFLKEHKCNITEKVPQESDSQEIVLLRVAELQHSTIEQTIPSEINITTGEIFNDINDLRVKYNDAVLGDSSDDNRIPLSMQLHRSKKEKATAPISNVCTDKQKAKKIKEHECPTCGRIFYRAHHLNQHAFTHSGEKPFSCNLCTKRFRRLDYIKKHMYVHSAEPRPKPKKFKKHECPTCGRKFHKRADLNRHTLTHSAKKPYSCDICKKEFTRAKQFQKHMDRHSDLKPFVDSV